jgi:hypothetical protein
VARGLSRGSPKQARSIYAARFFHRKSRQGRCGVFLKINPPRYLASLADLDWPDEKCIEIIRNIAISMTNDSRLLINEILVEPLYRNGQVHDVAPGEQGVGDAPEPLPANYGDGFQLRHDNMMMVNFHGKERNREEFIELVAKAGLEVTRIYTLAGVQDAVIECRKPSK